MGAGVPNEVVNFGFDHDSPEFAANATGWPEPSAYIQWKGTDVCMDFHCECGAFCHFDGDFAYVVKCPHCGSIWEMPSTVYPRKADGRTFSGHVEAAKILQPDEDHCDESGNPQPVA